MPRCSRMAPRAHRRWAEKPHILLSCLLSSHFLSLFSHFPFMQGLATMWTSVNDCCLCHWKYIWHWSLYSTATYPIQITQEFAWQNLNLRILKTFKHTAIKSFCRPSKRTGCYTEKNLNSGRKDEITLYHIQNRNKTDHNKREMHQISNSDDRLLENTIEELLNLWRWLLLLSWWLLGYIEHEEQVQKKGNKTCEYNI